MPFAGSQKSKLDEKLRLLIPVSYWRGLDKNTEGDSFFAMPGRDGKSIWVVPNRVYEREQAEWPPLERLSRDAFRVRRFELAHTEPLTADSQGRVQLTENMLKLIGVDPEVDRSVMLVGLGSRFEIFRPSTFEENTADVWKTYSDLREAALKEVQEIREHDQRIAVKC